MKTITPKEKKVLELIAGGYSTGDVAAALDISKYTVLSHRRSLLGKFGVNNSVQLVMLAIKNKIIDVHDHKLKPAQYYDDQNGSR
jgi:DNA-binding CsgD family transcriptional regulator